MTPPPIPKRIGRNNALTINRKMSIEDKAKLTIERIEKRFIKKPIIIPITPPIKIPLFITKSIILINYLKFLCLCIYWNLGHRTRLRQDLYMTIELN